MAWLELNTQRRGCNELPWAVPFAASASAAGCHPFHSFSQSVGSTLFHFFLPFLSLSSSQFVCSTASFPHSHLQDRCQSTWIARLALLVFALLSNQQSHRAYLQITRLYRSSFSVASLPFLWMNLIRSICVGHFIHFYNSLLLFNECVFICASSVVQITNHLVLFRLNFKLQQEHSRYSFNDS